MKELMKAFATPHSFVFPLDRSVWAETLPIQSILLRSTHSDPQNYPELRPTHQKVEKSRSGRYSNRYKTCKNYLIFKILKKK